MKRGVINELRRRLGPGAVKTAGADRFVHAFDATADPLLPDVVVIPSSVDELVWACLKLWEEGVAVTPRGAGTGFSGGAVAAAGGAVVVCDRLRRISAPDGDEVFVGPGVIGDDLNRFLKPFELMYPVDPASSEVSTLGGNVAENAGGPRALKYGVTREYVRALDVLSPGRSRELYRAVAGSADGVGLLVGSEGTLALTLGITLRLVPLPAATAAVVATFTSPAAAVEAVTAAFDAGVRPAKLEFLDGVCVACINAWAPGSFEKDVGAALMMELDGEAEEVAAALVAATGVWRRGGARDVRTAGDETAAKALWRLRTSVSPSLGLVAPHKLNEDVCIPRSRLGALIEFVRELEVTSGLPVPTFGHVGDGNLHVNVMYDRRDAAATARANAAAAALIERVIAWGGTITGEHGIGRAKARFLPVEQGAYERELSARVKRHFDPGGLLNPGKLWWA